jgi:hypothetical protein
MADNLPPLVQYAKSLQAAKVAFEKWAFERGLCADDWPSHWKALQEAARQERERYEELLKAAKFVAFSNGFDAAYPDKLDALRALVRRSPSPATQGQK